MKNSTRFFVVCSLFILIACYSCSAPSSEAEMKAAQQAMDTAKSLHSEDLAASNWQDALQAWEQGQAAVKEGKSAKAFFIRAKSRFEKCTAIAKSQGDVLSREVSDMQLRIGEGLSKVKAGIVKGKLSAKVQKQVQEIAAEVEKGAETIDSLVSQKDFLKAKNTAREMQARIYNAQLIMAGKKPLS
jgi:hypothetical protein